MPGSIFYADSVNRILNDKLGERLSILDISNTAGKGVVNETPVFLKAYNSKLTKGGGVVHVPGVVGTGYKFDTPLNLTGVGAIEFVGEGRASKIFRGANMPADKGMIDLAGAKNVTFRRLLFDGSVTVPVGVLYGSFGNDPVNAAFTMNSMVWVHGGEDITFEDCDFEHTGGYAALLDARFADIKRVKFVNCRFRNNRPHLFGNAGDMNYGSWTGGIFYYNRGVSGSATGVQDLTVRECEFARNTGNCVWGHWQGFEAFHQRVHVDHNTFVDCGLEGVRFGNVVGGSALGNSFRRIGYICVSDVSVSTPKWLAGKVPAAIGTSGIVRLVPYSNNNFVSINGVAINGDGYSYGAMHGNNVRVPDSSNPEYDEDLIGTGFGPGGGGVNRSAGIVLGNTVAGVGGLGVTITGNLFDNLGGVAIGLYGARKCQAVGNLILTPSTAFLAPIAMGGFGADPNQNASDNLITENTIHYSPATAKPAILEDPTYRAFVPTDVNRVVKNIILGNTNGFEFQKDPNSDSNTALHFTTNASVNFQHRHGIMRTGMASDSSSALRFYTQDGGTFGYLHMQLQSYWQAGARGPLLNVSESVDPDLGIGVGGVITTGPYTSTQFTNAMVTGKLCATGFFALTNSSFSDAEANLLNDDWALLRWENTSNQWEQSITTSAGARVWTPFAGGGGGTGTPAPPANSVQFNNASAFGGSANFTFDPTGRLVLVTSFAYDAVHVVGGGGFLGDNVNVEKYAAFSPVASITPSGGGTFVSKVMLFADSAVNRLRLVRGTGSAAYTDHDLHAANLYASGTLYNAIQAPAGGLSANSATITGTIPTTIYAQNGGVAAKWLTATEYITFLELATEPDLSAFSQARIYAKSDHVLYLSTHGGPYVPFSGQNAAGTDGQIQFNFGGGVFGAQPQLYWNYDTLRMKIETNLHDVTGLPFQAALEVFNGWVFSDVGFVTDNESGNSILTSGGVRGKWLTANESLILKHVTPVAGPPAIPELSLSGELRIHAGVTGQLYKSNNGGPWGPLGGSGSPGGLDGAIQFNDDGSFGGEEGFLYWDKINNLLFVTCVAGQPAINTSGGWIQSEGGFLTMNPGYTAIQAPEGGVLAKSVNATEYLAISEATLSAPLAGDAFTNKSIFRLSPGSGGWLELYYGGYGTKGNLALENLAAGTNVASPLISTSGNVNTDHWIINVPGHTYAFRSGGPSVQLLDYTLGQFPLTITPNATATETQIQTVGHFKTSGGLVFAEQSVAPPISANWEVRIYANTNHQLYISTHGAAYGPFGGGGSSGAAGTDTMVQWNNGGVFAGSDNFKWDNPNGILNVVNSINITNYYGATIPHLVMYRAVATTHTYHIGVDGSAQWYVRSATMGPVLLTITPNATATSCLLSAPGMIIAPYLKADEVLIFKQLSGAGPALSAPGEVKLYANTSGQLYISTAGSAWGPFTGGGAITTPAGANTQVQYNNSGSFGATANFVWSTANTRVEVIGSIQTQSTSQPEHWVLYRNVAPAMIYHIGIDSLARLVFYDAISLVTSLAILHTDIAANVVVECPGTVRSLNFSATGTSFSSILVGSGGVDAKWVKVKESLIFDGLASAPTNLSTGVETRLYASSAGVLYKSSLGAGWVPLSGGGGGAGGANTQVQYNASGALAGDGDLTFSPGVGVGTYATLNLWGYMRFDITGGHSWQLSAQSSATPQLAQFWIRDETSGLTMLQLLPSPSADPTLVMVYTQGYYESGNGFNAAGNKFNAIRSTGGGGVSVASLRAAYYTHIGDSWTTPGMMSGDSVSNGCMYHEGSTNTIKVRVGGVWKTVSVF